MIFLSLAYLECHSIVLLVLGPFTPLHPEERHMMPIPRIPRGDEMPPGWKRELYTVSGIVVSTTVTTRGWLWWKKPCVRLVVSIDPESIPTGRRQIAYIAGLENKTGEHPTTAEVFLSEPDASPHTVGTAVKLELGVARLDDQFFHRMDPLQLVRINGQLPQAA